MKWIEKQPEEGDTVKIEFSDWTEMGTRIGVFLRKYDERMIVDLGRTKIYLDKLTTFFVLTK